MAFQISIGDVVLMTQIAWRLAQTFTKGRKSAPAEFCEVENQLYSLSAALEALRSARERGDIDIRVDNSVSMPLRSEDQAHGQNIVDNILRNCLQTLKHLENIVQKYSIILHPTPTLSTSRLGTWNQHLIKNWRKIEWTTEKGDLDALRSQIMIHANSLNLLLGISASSQSASIRKSVERTSDMVKELYEWYKDNLKGTLGSRDSDTVMKIVPMTNISSDAMAVHIHNSHHTFQLAIGTNGGREILCPEAYHNRQENQMAKLTFDCSCQGHGSSGLHQTAIQRYELSHLAFPVRLAAAERSWIIYKAVDRTTNQLVTLYIVQINPSYIQSLEETVLQDLAIRRADMILSQGVGNSLTYISADTEEERVLASIGELKIAQKSVESVTFTHDGSSHSRKWVDNIQILQYQTLNLNAVMRKGQEEPLQPMEYAEIMITYDQQEEDDQDDVMSNTLNLRRDTISKLDDSNALVCINSIDVTGTFNDGRTVSLDHVGVTVQLTSRKAATELHEKLEDMRMELFIRSLQYPRSYEKVALRLQVAKVECDNIYISSADVTVATNTQGRHRLIIESRNKCTIVSQVLVENFFDSPSGKPDYSGPTYVVQIEGDGKRNVYKYERGFRYLKLSNPQGKS
ncbi:hypothetical protein F4821DRAFT_190588 [Hypoxylon rubiginosum]|uniref:Uncharacterized protein n=1 Tax=Hypoxylon rubiginosum TaxID=110542 RepID=A0ACC0CT39_9PEZI|nr:hypothetical protein F4821DRAFT_190588 [Hypoxylon rubiginosum]